MQTGSLSKILTPNGAIFIFKINKNFIKEFLNLKNVIFKMRKKDAIDINTMQDYQEAKKLFKINFLKILKFLLFSLPCIINYFSIFFYTSYY